MSEISGLPASLFAPDSSPVPENPDELGRDTFLNLLTTQLQNQDPLSPMDNEAFIAQLAQFTSVESLLDMRNILETVVMGIASLNNASMASLLGTEVTVADNRFRYDGEGDQTLHFDAPSALSTATVRVRDENGKVVATFSIGAQEAGRGEITWDGTGIDGQQLPQGVYSFEVEATSSDGSPVDVRELMVGIVTEMDYTDGNPRPSVDGIPVNLGDVLTLQQSASD